MKITFLPNEITWSGDQGKNLLEIAGEVGVPIDGNCSGAGTCGKCTVIVDGKSLLACQYIPEDDITVTVPSGKRVEERKESLNILFDSFSPDNEYYKGSKDIYGMAFDIGTTTVVGNLWNLKNGESLGSYAMTNPQGVHGGDVISRITYVMDDDKNLDELHNKIINCLNTITTELTKKNNINPEDVKKTVVVGNTTMSHLFVKEDPSSLALAPFDPAFEGSVSGKLGELRLAGNPDGDFFLVSGIAGHVGSDVTSGIVASSLVDRKDTVLYIDIGTNGEIVLASNGKLMTCSTAAGPAFEGATVSQGMRAAGGAIEKVLIENDDVTCATIGDTMAVGICGSGILDAVAQMKEAGLINKTGKLFKKDEYEKKNGNSKLSERLFEKDNAKQFLLANKSDGSHIAVTQQDIREVQLAKAAIAAGINLMLNEMNLGLSDIDEVIIAGAFGSHIDCENSKKIGLIPDIPSEKIHFLGNTAGMGASMILLSDQKRKLSEDVVREIAHLELALCKDFQDVYLAEMSFN